MSEEQKAQLEALFDEIDLASQNYSASIDRSVSHPHETRRRSSGSLSRR